MLIILRFPKKRKHAILLLFSYVGNELHSTRHTDCEPRSVFPWNPRGSQIFTIAFASSKIVQVKMHRGADASTFGGRTMRSLRTVMLDAITLTKM